MSLMSHTEDLQVWHKSCERPAPLVPFRGRWIRPLLTTETNCSRQISSGWTWHGRILSLTISGNSFQSQQIIQHTSEIGKLKCGWVAGIEITMLQVILAATLTWKMMEDCEIRGLNIATGSMNLILCRLLHSWEKAAICQWSPRTDCFNGFGSVKNRKIRLIVY